jgi:hypothetical protein
MTTRPRRLALAVGLPILAIALAACGGTSPGSVGPATAGPSPAPTATPGNPDHSPAPGLTQTDTEWGRIWDGVPAGFPRYTGARDADDATPAPVSDAYVVEGGDPEEIGAWLQAAMEAATYSTESLSGPLEDGSLVLDSVGEGSCRIQTTVAPLGELVLVTVRYGADCPAS